MDDAEYVRARIDDQIEWHDRKSARSQRWYKRLRAVEIVCAAAIPFVSAIGAFAGAGSAWTALSPARLGVSALGMIVAMISGVLALYRLEDQWTGYRATAEALRSEKFKFLTRTGDYACPDPFALLVERSEAILTKQTETWAFRGGKRGGAAASVVSIDRR